MDAASATQTVESFGKQALVDGAMDVPHRHVGDNGSFRRCKHIRESTHRPT